jgi:hypothetical protein
MKRIVVLLALSLLVSPVFAEDEPAKEKKLTMQQEKMKKCNADAKALGLKGDEYKKFRNDCLKKK